MAPRAIRFDISDETSGPREMGTEKLPPAEMESRREDDAPTPAAKRTAMLIPQSSIKGCDIVKGDAEDGMPFTAKAGRKDPPPSTVTGGAEDGTPMKVGLKGAPHSSAVMGDGNGAPRHAKGCPKDDTHSTVKGATENVTLEPPCLKANIPPSTAGWESKAFAVPQAWPTPETTKSVAPHRHFKVKSMKRNYESMLASRWLRVDELPARRLQCSASDCPPAKAQAK